MLRKFSVSRTNDVIIITLLIFLSFVFHLLVLFAQSKSQFVLFSDAAVYMFMARAFLRGDFLTLVHPMWAPLYPIISAFFYLLIKNWNIAPRMTSLVSISLLLIPLYFLAKTFTNRFFAVLVCVSVTLFRPLVLSAISPLSESLFVSLFWFGLYFSLLSLKNKDLLITLLAGIFWGLNYLTRVEGSIAFLIFLFFLLFDLLKEYLIKKKGVLRRSILIFVLALVGFLVVVLPYQLASLEKFKRPLTLEKATALMLYGDYSRVNSAKTSTWAQDIYSLRTPNAKSEFFANFGDYVGKHYDQIFADTITRVKGEMKILFSYLSWTEKIFLVLGLLAWILIIKRSKEALYLTITLLGSFLLTMVFAPSVEARYAYNFFTLIPLLIVLGAFYFYKLMKRMKIQLALRSAIMIFIFYTMFSVPYKAFGDNLSFKSIDFKKEYILAEDAWLLKNDPQKRVMMHHEGFGFFSDSFIIYTPTIGNIADLVRYAHLWKTSYLIAQYGELPTQFNFLITNPRDYPGLKLQVNDQVLIYKLE